MNQVTCRLDDYVEKANEFIPERFDRDSDFKKLRPFTMLPFGHGPRACIGRRVAEMSMYIFLYRVCILNKLNRSLSFLCKTFT